MDDSLCNPVQCEEINVRVDIRPKSYYMDQFQAQSITLESGLIIPLQYDGVLPYLPVRRPTINELKSCDRYTLTSRFDWDPYKTGSSFSRMEYSDTEI